MLTAAPWVFVRGNHESCARAGQGWYRFLDALPWSSERSCDDARNDPVADFNVPYAVKITGDTQIIVFDATFSGGNAYKSTDSAFIQYTQAMREVARLQQGARQNWLVNHHPILGFTPAAAGAVRPGSASLQSALASAAPQRYFRAGISLALHRHVHLFEAISFASPHPATLVVGNSGSLPGYTLNNRLPTDARPAPQALVKQFSTHPGFGFSVLDKVDPSGADSGWNLTAFHVAGRALLRCMLRDADMSCTQVVTAP